MSRIPADYIGKAPFFQKWDQKAFGFDTAHMHWQARMLYKDLLNKAFHISTRPDLPNDDSQLTNILGIPPEVWAEHKVAVRAMFTLDIETGLLWQKRLRNDWQDLHIYRLQQKKRIESRWAAAKALKTQRVDTTVLPANNHGNTSRVEKSIEVKNIDDSAGASPVPAVQSNPIVAQGEEVNPNVNSADIGNQQLEYLISVIANWTDYLPPDTKGLEALIRRFPMSDIEDAFTHFLESKTDKEILPAVRLFSQETNGAGVILGRKRFLAEIKAEREKKS